PVGEDVARLCRRPGERCPGPTDGGWVPDGPGAAVVARRHEADLAAPLGVTRLVEAPHLLAVGLEVDDGAAGGLRMEGHGAVRRGEESPRPVDEPADVLRGETDHRPRVDAGRFWLRHDDRAARSTPPSLAPVVAHEDGDATRVAARLNDRGPPEAGIEKVHLAHLAPGLRWRRWWWHG